MYIPKPSFRKSFIIIICIALFAALFAGAGTAQAADYWNEKVEAALSHSGTNKAELVKALEQTPGPARDGMQFLIANMPERDLKSLQADFLLENVSLAYKAAEEFPWASGVSQDLFLNNVLPYANVTERRENWRQQVYDLVKPLVKDCKTTGEAAMLINQTLFKQTKVHYSTKRRAPDQGPLETMKSTVATCTGLSIMLVDACRSVGIPARLAGTPLWVNNSGNHTWVEIWDGGAWHFAGAAEADPKGFDRGWFVGNASQAIKNDRLHAIYAVSYRKTGLAFPLEWDPDQDYVNAVNVTERYTTKPQTNDTSLMLLLVNVLNKPVGERVAAKVTVTDSMDSNIHFEGTSKTDPADINDHVSFNIPKQRTYIVEAEYEGLKNRRFYSPGTNVHDVLVVHMSGVPVVMSPAPAMCAPPTAIVALSQKQEKKLKAAVTGYFTAPEDKHDNWEFSSSLNSLLAKNEPAVRKAVWEAYVAAPIHDLLKQGYDQDKVYSGDKVSPYTVKNVGTRPAKGWALFIAMHGGGGTTQEFNDSQWRHMQIYYRDHPEVGGYRYLALRAPDNSWNGFYTGYAYPLIANLIQQFLLFGDVDPNKVFIMGYSHGGYGAYAIGPKMADRFAAIHASAAALADGAQPQTLRNTPFTTMVGGNDTAYGRNKHAEELDEKIKQLKGDRKDIYPVTVSIIANHPHSGLPDREKIAEMYPAVRNTVPHEITWPLTDDVNKDFFWLHVPSPAHECELDATYKDNHVTVKSSNITQASVLLDDRMVDLKEPVELEVNGKTRKVKVKPDLRTLCRTMQRRGDPDLAFTVEIPLTLP